jgi:cyclohexanecarboxylate-CoA ligase
VTASGFAAVLDQWAARQPDKVAVVDDADRVTYAELARRVEGQAASLRAGEVVCTQLPNRIDAVVACFAANRAGAVHSPIVPTLGTREAEAVTAQVAGLDRRGAGPDAVAVVLWTSGTTAGPKGVLHSTATLSAELRAMAEFHRLGADEVFVMPAPVAHVSGLLYGVLLPIWLGATSVLLERWSPETFLAAVERERGTFCGGPPTFLQGAVDAPDLDRYDVSSLRIFPTGGADVPPDLIRRAIDRLGVRTGRGYGSSEFPSVTSSAGPDEPLERRLHTEGRPIGANQVQVRDGEIWARGPELFLGYVDGSEEIDGDGWFRTGDLGEVDDEGYLTVTGRLKDVIIRKGEKISAPELEALLATHPAIADVAVVAEPDPERGELACAVVVAATGAAPPTVADLAAFLADRGVARWKAPERVRLVEVLPRTASGKVQKHLLR